MVAIALWPFVAGAASAERKKKEDEGKEPDDTEVPPPFIHGDLPSINGARPLPPRNFFSMRALCFRIRV